MRVFETIKAAVPLRQAAEHYGLRVLSNGMTCCRSPTMQSLPTIGSGSAFVFSGIICGIFISDSCGIVLRNRVTPFIPALPRR